MFRGISDLISGLALFLPFKVLVVIVALGALAAAPVWFETVRDKQIRGTIRKMVRASDTDRVALSAHAMALAASKPRRLGTLVRQAIHYDQRRLRDDAMAALAAIGGTEVEVRHLRTLIAPQRIHFRDPMEAMVRIEQLLEQGLHVAAREQLDAATARFPNDPDLMALQVQFPASEGVRPIVPETAE